MKIGIFTDSHYSPTERNGNRFNSMSLAKIREALDCFRQEGVDACLCLGDLTDRCESPAVSRRCLEEITLLFEEARKHFPVFVVPGNHDFIGWRRQDFFRRVGSPCPPYSRVIGNLRFVFLDGNYDGAGRSFDSFDFEWDSAYLSEEQLSWLSAELKDSAEECIVLCHELIDPQGEERHSLKNKAAICKVLEDSGKVKLVLQGHYHEGDEHTVGGIRYIAYPAMCEGEENRYSILEL